jgi:hypothetical protein
MRGKFQVDANPVPSDRFYIRKINKYIRIALCYCGVTRGNNLRLTFELGEELAFDARQPVFYQIFCCAFGLCWDNNFRALFKGKIQKADKL